MVDFTEAPPPTSPPLCRLGWVAGIMQSRHAPPRARIGGLCLPLNSRKPGRALPAAGETWTGARPGLATQPLGTQSPLGGGGGDESRQRCGTGPCRTHETSDISTWELHTRAGTDRGSWLRGVWGVWSARSPTQPHPGTPGHQDALVPPIRPQSPPPRSGGVGFYVRPLYIPYQARVLRDWG